MVSTRGIKLKFSENERVLCYEPDPTKAKVLYDSKVLHVVVSKDQRGRKNVEYLIHFQGWNPSWDRYVSEEYVLKDTPENRQLQKDLAEKSQLQLGAYLYRKDRKKARKTSTAPSSDEGSSSSPARMDTDEMSTSSEESSIEDETFPIELTPELRSCLEQDHYLINTKNKLVKLPAEPNVVSILEGYWRHYAANQVCDLSEKNSKHRLFAQKRRPDDVQRNLSVCTEVLDGLRIYFDYLLTDLLLYKSEQGQIETKQAVYNTTVEEASTNKNYLDYINYPSMSEEDPQSEQQQAIQRKRSLRSSKNVELVSNGISHDSKHKTSDGSSDTSSNNSKTCMRLLPDYVHSQDPPPPCLVYGAVHLLRLFVKLPELFNAANLEEGKWKSLAQHLELFIEYLNEHRDWFGDKFYMDK